MQEEAWGKESTSQQSSMDSDGQTGARIYFMGMCFSWSRRGRPKPREPCLPPAVQKAPSVLQAGELGLLVSRLFPRASSGLLP